MSNLFYAGKRIFQNSSAVGWVEEDKGILFSRRLSPENRVPRRGGCEARSLHPGGLDVLRDDVVRRAVVLDEVAVRGAAREGFDAELAGSGEQVEDVGVADMVLNEIKDVFL